MKLRKTFLPLIVKILFISFSQSFYQNNISSQHFRKKYNQYNILPQDNQKFQLDQKQNNKANVVINLEKQELSQDKQIQLINYLQERQAFIQQKIQYKQISLKDNKFQIILSQNYNAQSFLQQPQSQHFVNLYNNENTLYTGKFGVGNPPQQLDVIYDTGSSLTWINSVYCEQVGCKNADYSFNYRKSDTYLKYNPEGTDRYLFDFQFGSGNLTSLMSQEDVWLDGVKIQNATIFEIYQYQGEVFEYGEFDGIVGLGLQFGEIPTIFQLLLEKKYIDHPILSFYLDRTQNRAKSKMIVGGVDQSLYHQNTLKYHKVVSDLYWMVKLDRILLNDEDTKICSPKDAEKQCYAVLDTGTTLLTGPKNDLEKLLNQIQTDEKCQNFGEMPSIVYEISGEKYYLSPQEYIITVTDNSINPIYEHSQKQDIINCVGSFSDLDLGEGFENVWILGDIFISKYYTIFDLSNDKKQIGLAESINQ